MGAKNAGKRRRPVFGVGGDAARGPPDSLVNGAAFMNILIAATELAPHVSLSPAAESIASLTKALRLLGHDVTLVLPRFPAFEAAGLMAARRLTPLALPDGGEAFVYDISLPSGARLVLVDAPGVEMAAIGSGSDGEARALGRYASAVAALVGQLGDRPPFDILHAHDARASLCLLQLRVAGGNELGKVLSVHDARDVGAFPLSVQKELGIADAFATQQSYKSGDEFCLLKGGLSLADVVIAPSETYATELVSVARFAGISRAFRSAAPVGVLGGVDHAIYNPATDSALTSRYDAQDPANKGRNKSALLKELGLPIELVRPLVLFEEVDPADGGIETLLGALAQIARLELALVITTRRELSDMQRSAIATVDDRVLVLPSPDARQRRRLLSAADFYLGIERHNPGGQRLQQAARYGAIPVAFAADAAKEVVVDADADLKTGTGFLFDSLTQRGVLGALGRAVTAFRSPHYLKLLSRVMRQDLAWDRPARRHLQLYRQAAGSSR